MVVASGLGLGFGSAAGLGRDAPTGLGRYLAAVLCFGGAAGAGFAWAWALAAAGLLAVGTGFGARVGGFPGRLAGGVLDQDALVVEDEVVVVMEVVESEARRGLWGTARAS